MHFDGDCLRPATLACDAAFGCGEPATISRVTPQGAARGRPPSASAAWRHGSIFKARSPRPACCRSALTTEDFSQHGPGAVLALRPIERGVSVFTLIEGTVDRPNEIW
jgi:hypothetical protein